MSVCRGCSKGCVEINLKDLCAECDPPAERFPLLAYAADPPHRLVGTCSGEQVVFMQLYPPGHKFNVELNGKVVLIGKRFGSQQRLHIAAENIDLVIEALQYAKQDLMQDRCELGGVGGCGCGGSAGQCRKGRGL